MRAGVGDPVENPVPVSVSVLSKPGSATVYFPWNDSPFLSKLLFSCSHFSLRVPLCYNPNYRLPSRPSLGNFLALLIITHTHQGLGGGLPAVLRPGPRQTLSPVPPGDSPWSGPWVPIEGSAQGQMQPVQ